MTDKRILYTRPDGGVSIIIPAPGFVKQFTTEDKALAAIQAKDVPSDGSDVVVVNITDVPADRTFRDAWEQSAPGVITVDMPKAREIHADHIARTQVAEIARLKVDERKERLKANTAQANAHAATVVALEALDLNVLATQIGNAPNATALSAIWPANVPRS